jgi:Protein of unknown function (DUF3800)
MVVQYVAYIDESGDPGLKGIKPKTPGGASEWLVLGCLLVRIENDNALLPWVRDLISKFNNHQTSDIHFSDLNPAKKTTACNFLAEKPCRIFVTASNKQNIENYENPNLSDQKKHWYYWWMTRLLMERVTDFCERMTPQHLLGQHKIRFVFSRRGRMRYADLDEYLWKIYWQSKFKMLFLEYGDIKWSMIDFDEIFVRDHAALAGLQLADIVAGSFFQAVERDRPADCDARYAKLLKPIFARNKNKKELGYGIKSMPDLHLMNLVPQQKEIFEFYGYNPDGWK